MVLWAVAFVLVGTKLALDMRARLKAQQLAGPDAYYASCARAVAGGVAPIHRGETGYREALDRDRDGVACEPFH